MPQVSAHTSGGTTAYDMGDRTTAAIVVASASVVGTVPAGSVLASFTASVGVVMSCPTACSPHGSMRQTPSL